MSFSMFAGISSWYSGPTASKLVPGCLQYALVCNARKELTRTRRWESGLQPAWLGYRAEVMPGVRPEIKELSVPQLLLWGRRPIPLNPVY